MSGTPPVAAVVVLFHPDAGRMARLVDVLLADGVLVVLADNGEPPARAYPAGCAVVAMGGNKGIAAAQNAGVAAARAGGAGTVILFDQDSAVDPGFAAALTQGMRPDAAELRAARAVDDVTGAVLPVERLDDRGRPTSAPAAAGDVADVVIASGMAMTLAAYDRVGPFDEDLFIDLVDSEWCLRARAAGLPIRVSAGATMRHRIGGATRRLGPFRVAVHSPARAYYQVRNALLLLRRPHVPARYALRNAAATLANRGLLALTSPGKRRYCGNMARGIFDGALGRGGRGPVSTSPSSAA